jgi:hypothetical protein
VIVKYVQPLVKMGATVTVLVAVDADHQYCWRPEVTLWDESLCGTPPAHATRFVGSWPSTPAGYELVAARLLIMAAGHEGKPMDDAALERWTRVRFERGMTSGAENDEAPLAFVR